MLEQLNVWEEDDSDMPAAPKPRRKRPGKKARNAQKAANIAK